MCKSRAPACHLRLSLLLWRGVTVLASARSVVRTSTDAFVRCLLLGVLWPSFRLVAFFSFGGLQSTTHLFPPKACLLAARHGSSVVPIQTHTSCVKWPCGGSFAAVAVPVDQITVVVPGGSTDKILRWRSETNESIKIAKTTLLRRTLLLRMRVCGQSNTSRRE